MSTHADEYHDAAWWESRYRDHNDGIWSGKVNVLFELTVADLRPGRALDLGAGEGGDAVWLAQRGWTVTAVDAAQTALDRLVKAAEQRGVAEQIRTERHDLTRSLPTGEFDLVSACYVHWGDDAERNRAVAGAARLVARGGTLVLIDHASAPPWSFWHGKKHRFPTAQETYEDLRLGADWRAVTVDSRRHTQTRRGETAEVTDNLIVTRRSRADMDRADQAGPN